MLSFHRGTLIEYHGGGGELSPAKPNCNQYYDRAPLHEGGALLCPFLVRGFFKLNKWRNQ